MSDLSEIRLNLQLFAEGGEGSEGAADGVDASSPDAEMGVSQTPTGDGAPEEQPDLDAEFDELIKGKYKDVYNHRVKSTIDGRMARSRATEKQAREMKSVLDVFASNLGIDPNDHAALMKAAQDNGVSDEALERGVSEEQVRVERENRLLRAQRQQEERNRQEFMRTVEEQKVKAIYPGFDYATEAQSPTFMAMLDCGVDMKAAYEAMHSDEIHMGIMQYTSDRVKENMAKTIASGNKRPNENGASPKGAVSAKKSVSAMSDAEFDSFCNDIMSGRYPT